MSYYLVTYANEKPKAGHRPVTSTRVVEAESSTEAIGIFLTRSANGSLWQLQADWVGTDIIRKGKE